MPLLSAENLSKTFTRGGVRVHAVSGVDLSVEAGETLALIGESGSGKSTVGRLALALATPDTGRVVFDGRDLGTLSARDLRRLRSQFQVVFQEPFESLNPRMTVGAIVGEPLKIFEPGLSRAQRRMRVVETLEEVTLSADFLERHPRQLSGGQQQRVGIARAIVTRPRFIVLDEPTSSLDLTVRAAILNLLARLQAKHGLAYLFISHDIQTVHYFSTRTAVMYLGRIVELGTTSEVITSPRHPYTRALLSAALSADPKEKPPHYPLRGELAATGPDAVGCPLVGRCPIALPACTHTPVTLETIADDHQVACIRAGEPSAELLHAAAAAPEAEAR